MAVEKAQLQWGHPFTENVMLCLVDPVKHLRRSWDGSELVEEGCGGDLSCLMAQIPEVHMAHPLHVRDCCTSNILDRKGQRP